MIKFKQTAATPEPHPASAASPASLPAKLPAVAPAAPEASRVKRKPAPAASKNPETQLSVAFDESSPDKG